LTHEFNFAMLPSIMNQSNGGKKWSILKMPFAQTKIVKTMD
jgi:hypothetical protein